MSELKQQREHEGAIVPVSKRTLMNGGSPVAGYIAAHGVGMSGTFFKFGKEGFRKTTDDSPMPDGEYVSVYDQIQVGWVKFNGKGAAPTRKMGSVFDGFVPPARDTLGDTDESLWEEGLNGKPADPWQFQILLPLQHVESGELYIFQTSSITGRRAADALIAACGRMAKTEPDHYPVIRLRVGGFQHRDDRVGWVKTPAFDRVGKALKADTTVATTSAAGDMNDEIPW